MPGFAAAIISRIPATLRAVPAALSRFPLEEQGIKGLVLGRGRDAPQGELGQKGFELGFDRSERVHLRALKKAGLVFQAADLRFLGVERSVLERASFSQ